MGKLIQFFEYYLLKNTSVKKFRPVFYRILNVYPKALQKQQCNLLTSPLTTNLKTKITSTMTKKK